ncbi:MAG: CRTAC1 family protein [Candidatus Tectomicrobia bacterium]|uniref:CRTAC1 family protein n=1 Tax=Tectimicrobiota bacterium TaxID=2528274 RepID=A0A938B364_UNCTE|nr:CRTAC1 family protein [Candidatus Tectomicrobia bacterium]
MVTQGWCRRYTARLTAAVLIIALYGIARLPVLSDTERATLAARFRFGRLLLPEVPSQTPRMVRAVHPDLQHISAWISSVGAAVALHDLDGDGLANDVCYVDTRTDQVIVAPVPGTPTRYAPLTLQPGALPYNPNTMAPMGCLPGDLNEDGQADLLVYYWGRTPIAFLRTGPGSLNADSYTPYDIVPGGERWYTNAAALADLDGDGHADLIIGNYFPDGAHILDATATSREAMQDSMSRAYNGGKKHFLLWAGATVHPHPTVHFRAAETALEHHVLHGWTLALGAADLDGDLLPELYLANDFGPDRLLHNRSRPGELRFALLEGVKTFTTPNSKVLGHDSFKGMGIDFADLNGDGWLDLYVSNIATEYALEESHLVFLSTAQPARMQQGIAPYVDHSEALGLSRSGWGWEARLGDFDNDSVLEALQATGFVQGQVNRWPELHELAMGNDALLHRPASWLRVQPGDDLSGHQLNPFFVRASDGRYYDLARQVGLDIPYVSRGIATADVDGDGRLDFAVANQWQPSLFYQNLSPHAGTFLGLHLLLPLHSEAPAHTWVRAGHPGMDTPGRPALGAAVTVQLPDGRRLVAQVDGGNGHSGKRSPDLHFGLGRIPSTASLQVTLRWRDPQGRVQHTILSLTPGWHTVVLGWPAGKEG